MASFDELNRILNNSSAQAGSPNRGGSGNPGGVHNTSPGRPQPAQTPDYLAQLDQMYQNYYNGQNPALGRYRPPTMGGDGSDPRNWNDYGGYAYNLPTNFGPAQTSWTQSQRRPGHSMGYFQEQGRLADRNTAAGIANGSIVPVEVPNRGRPGTHTNYSRPGQQGGYAWGDPEMYAVWQANRNAMQTGQGDTMYAGGSPTFDESGRWTREEMAASRGGSPYRAPRETHVGGPASNEKPPPVPVNGGTKGPAQVADQLAALEDWEFRQRGRFNNRWGRY